MNGEMRRTEKIFLCLYTLFSVVMTLASFPYEKDARAIVVPIGICLVLGWIVFLKQYKDYTTRVYIYTAAMLLAFLRYATFTDTYYVILVPFLVVVTAVSLFKNPQLVYLQTFTFLGITAYHFFVMHTLQILNMHDILRLIGQAGCSLAVVYLNWNFARRDCRMEQALRDTIETLQDTEHSKDEFMANVSHEIRTPLNTICGMSELVLREELENQVRENVFHIQTAGRSLQSIVSDVLDYSELETNKICIYEEPYNFSSVMNDVINMAIAQKEEKNIELIVDCDTKIPRSMVGDSEKLCRMISCLVENAIKFTDKGCVMVVVRARKEHYGVNLCVSVKDTGIGMTQEELERLFTSFNQVDTKKNRRQNGIGLGLAITRRMVELMHGFLTVKSELGKGSEFQFVIPQRVEDERPMLAIKDAEQVRMGIYVNTEKYSISEIRDNYMSMIANMVAQLGTNMSQCHSLAELKKKAERNTFTHVLITIDEYREEPAYFDMLSEKIPVLLVLDRENDRDIKETFRRVYKPFYALSVANILNGHNLVQRRDGSHYLTQQFIAPNASVLVVDDSAMNLKVMEGLLRPYEVHFFEATSGEEALKMLEWAHYDLIFMDHMMPKMDGVETLHRIRKKSGQYYQTVPVIALTANAIGGAREMFLAEGFFDFVAKPIDLSNLERVLKKYLPPEMILPKTEWERAKEPKKPDEKQHVNEQPCTDEVWQIDEAQGVMYCGGEMSDYLDVVGIYYNTAQEKCAQMQRLYEAREWEEYTVLTHALKSTSMSIGANGLSELAKQQELAGKDNDEEYLLANHEPLMREYKAVLAEIDRRWGDKI